MSGVRDMLVVVRWRVRRRGLGSSGNWWPHDHEHSADPAAAHRERARESGRMCATDSNPVDETKSWIRAIFSPPPAALPQELCASCCR